MTAQDDAPAHDDGMVAPDVGAWAEEKHRLVSLYSTLFSSGMKTKWSKRTYVELYAGAGYSRVRGTSKFILGSPILALRVNDPFDKYVFCEERANKLEALKVRAKQIAPHANVAYVHGNRNYEHYLKEDADKVDKFLGSDSWRERWATAQWDAVKFTRFLADEFTKSMATLGYIPPPHYTMKEVRSHEKNLALYRLALFSRHERAYKLWDQVLKYSTDQTAFWD